MQHVEIAEESDLTFDGNTIVIHNGKRGRLLCKMTICIPTADREIFFFNDCYAVEPFEDGPFFTLGDSGGAVYVVCNSNKTLKAIGMVFAQCTCYSMTAVCQLKPIVDAFNVTPLLDSALFEKIKYE